MLKFLERTIATADQRLIVLPPPDAVIPPFFGNVTRNSEQHAELSHGLQRLRGEIYLKDGAVRPEQLTPDGRHRTPEDPRSWHLLVTDSKRRVNGCIWYLEHHGHPTLDQLRVRTSPLARDKEWQDKLRAAVALDAARARRERIRFAEVGGWAVAEKSHMGDCLLLILGLFSLSQRIGGAFVLSTATVRHSSAQILRRMGGAHLQGDGYTVPAYYDPAYECEMEILRFDTRRPSPRFVNLVEALKNRLAHVPVIALDEKPEVRVPESVAAAPRRLIRSLRPQLAVA